MENPNRKNGDPIYEGIVIFSYGGMQKLLGSFENLGAGVSSKETLMQLLYISGMKIKLFCCFCVDIPTCITSCGTLLAALETRLCTFTVARSGLVPTLKKINGH